MDNTEKTTNTDDKNIVKKESNLTDVVMRVFVDKFAGTNLLGIYAGGVAVLALWIIGLVIVGGLGTGALIGFAAFMALVTMAYVFIFFVGKHMRIALTSSFLVFGLIWGIAAMPKDLVGGEGEVKMGGKLSGTITEKKKYDELPPPPTIEAPTEAPAEGLAKGSVGEVPLPVPDEEADAETIKDAAPGVEAGEGDGTEIIVEDETGGAEDWEYVNFTQEYSEAPSIGNLVRPKYPAIAKDMGIEGDVVLLVYIDEKGRVKNAVVQSSPGLPAMEEEALKAAYKCTFSPAKQQGQPVGVWYSIIMQFQ